MIRFDIDQGSEAWFEARLGRVTGTRFQNLMSKETTDSYQTLITNIACEIVSGRGEEGYSNALMEAAKEIEPIARAEYESMFDVKVSLPGFVIPDEDNPFHNWVGVSPDGLCGRGGLEIKCPLMRTHFEYILGGKLPTTYRHQVQGSLFVTGLDYWDFMSYSPGLKPFVIRVYPDAGLHEEYESRLVSLIHAVENKISVYNKYDYQNE